MSYQYVTANNLYEKQNYMYSEYKGMVFLKDYLDSRKKFLNNTGGGYIQSDNVHGCHMEERLKEMIVLFRSGKENRETAALLDRYVKSFEVNKRIYTEYDDRWKPLKNSEFEAYELYLMFAECLIHAYQRTGCLRYLSCLLKVDDTILSVSDRLTSESQSYISWIIRSELDAFLGLSDKLGIHMEDGI